MIESNVRTLEDDGLFEAGGSEWSTKKDAPVRVSEEEEVAAAAAAVGEEPVVLKEAARPGLTDDDDGASGVSPKKTEELF